MFALQLGFQTSKAAGAELKGQVVTFLRVKEKGGWGREGPAPKKGGGSGAGGVVFLFAFSSAVIRDFQLKSEPSPTAW